MKSLVFVLFLGAIILSSGCLGAGNFQANAATETTQPQVPTIDEKLWTTVVDNTYVITATGGPDANRIKIPLDTDTAYRLSVVGEKRLQIIAFESQIVNTDSQGRYGGTDTAKVRKIANNVISYNGVFKTTQINKNLQIQWIYSTTETGVIGTSQNVKVKLEKYNGESTTFPEITSVPEPSRGTI
jgi:hypothetical protein